MLAGSTGKIMVQEGLEHELFTLTLELHDDGSMYRGDREWQQLFLQLNLNVHQTCQRERERESDCWLYQGWQSDCDKVY